MLAVKRHEKIIQLLEKDGSVKVSELKGLLQVTDKTIRDDLERLEQQGLLTRIHGGAVLPEGGSALLPMKSAPQKLLAEKAEIASLAVQIIEPDDIIALDGGSTTLEIAKQLDNQRLTVITNDLYIISELSRKEQIRLVVPGGYRTRNLLIGPESIDFLQKLNIQKAFVSTTGIHLEYGFTIFTSELINQKKALIQTTKSVFCVADHSKFDNCALLTFAELSDIHTIISDQGLSQETVHKYKEYGIHILQI